MSSESERIGTRQTRAIVAQMLAAAGGGAGGTGEVITAGSGLAKVGSEIRLAINTLPTG